MCIRDSPRSMRQFVTNLICMGKIIKPHRCVRQSVTINNGYVER